MTRPTNASAHAIVLTEIPQQRMMFGLLMTVLLAFIMSAAFPDPGYADSGSNQPGVDVHQLEGRGHGGPRAYHDMCRRNPALCAYDRQASLSLGITPSAKLTNSDWDLLAKVNTKVNERLQPREDIVMYGTSDFWTAGRNFGDCEDYMISKKHMLIEMGWKADQLLYAVVEGRDTPYHAVLIARTDKGDFVLDNLTNQISRWDQSGYRFVIRQSAERPDHWVRIAGQGERGHGQRLATR